MPFFPTDSIVFKPLPSAFIAPLDPCPHPKPQQHQPGAHSMTGCKICSIVLEKSVGGRQQIFGLGRGVIREPDPAELQRELDPLQRLLILTVLGQF